jgi:hypothetical protein
MEAMTGGAKLFEIGGSIVLIGRTRGDWRLERLQLRLSSFSFG